MQLSTWEGAIELASREEICLFAHTNNIKMMKMMVPKAGKVGWSLRKISALWAPETNEPALALCIIMIITSVFVCYRPATNGDS